jgi:ABC-2 type transport system permease protein
MNKTWQVALHEYQQHVFTRRFLFGLLSVPFFIGILIGLVILIISMNNNTTPLGFVDQSGLLADPLPAPPVEAPDKTTPIQAFPDETSARQALDAGQIQGYYVIPVDYLTSGKLKVVFLQAVKPAPRQQFYNFLEVNLLASVDASVSRRLLAGDEIIARSLDGSREMSSKNGWFSLFMPIIAAIGFIISMFTAGGYLMQAVVEEKENRTMEVILTSVSPNQFMSGKIIADISIGLTQIFAWLVFIIIAIRIAARSLDFLQGIQVSPQLLLLCLIILLPTFVMVSAFMALIGATVSEAREGQQMIGLISLPIWIPYLLFYVIIENPNSPLAVALSLFPLTSSLTMLLRQGVTILPAWQIALSSIILLLCSLAAIWLAGKAFRLGMLRYGKRLSLREIFSRRGGAA